MKREVLRLTLLDDVAVSESSASAGPHRGLDYLPGATLLGAAARSLYDSLDKKDAWTLFHSGKVRFGDGLPIASHPVENAVLVGLPVPFCWFEEKHDRAFNEKEYRLRFSKIWNLQFEEDGERRKGEEKQLEQLRRGHVAPEGTVVAPERVLRMRTAINAAKGIRREGALFGYQALSAGQEFVSLLEADDDVSTDLFGRVRDSLVGARLRIGRSRRTELGRVACSVERTERATEALAPLPGPVFEGPEGIGDIVFWLLSDLALEDKAGSPLLVPSLAQLFPGAPDVPLDPTGSFIRTGRYSPYNGYLRCHDTERIVLARGSVLRYRMGEGQAESLVIAGSAGLYREAGLGRLWCNPAPLWGLQPNIDLSVGLAVRLGVSQPETTPPANAYSAALLNWLGQRTAVGGRNEVIEREAAEWLRELRALYSSAREIAGTPSEPVGPRASQWGRVLDAANQPDIAAGHLMQRLFDTADAICKAGDAVWDAEGLLNKTPVRFRDWFRAKASDWLGTARPDAGPDAAARDLARLIGRVATDARRLVQHEKVN